MSKTPEQIRNEVLDEVIETVTKRARENVTRKLGHMTWAEVIVMIRALKYRTEQN